jgi:GTPase SAR1 family protein
MIVGENGVGKTCLMRRLLGKDIDDVTSTDGIDVVIRKCKIRLSDGKWILNEGI